MLVYTVRRILLTFPLVVVVVAAVGSLIYVVPGSPVDLILGDYATEADRLELMRSLGLDRSFLEQLSTYVQGVLQGDWGVSLLSGQSVLESLMLHITPTLILTLSSMLCAVVFGVPIGVYAALHKGKWLDSILMFGSLLLVSMPNFWLGPLLILIFSLWLDLLPVTEFGTLRGMILPSVTLGGSLSGIVARMTRESVVVSIQQDFYVTALAKGLSRSRVLWCHVLRHASIHVVSIIGLQFGALLTVAVITEAIFDWPGLGTLMFKALSERDYPLVQGCVIVFSMSYILMNLLTDLVYVKVDPRVDLYDIEN
ncbi:MAG: ABC transporter permease [Zetaproteobacteria bacterium]|nr:ABC transporter permease [Zetaproteobacteria bacterium]